MRFPPETVRDRTVVFVKPVPAGDQLVPLLVERKMPPPFVPAKRFVPATASARTSPFVRPEPAADQLAG